MYSKEERHFLSFSIPTKKKKSRKQWHKDITPLELSVNTKVPLQSLKCSPACRDDSIRC